MPIVWREGLSVGNDLIDADHKQLLTLINTVEELLTNDRSHGDLLVAIDRLWDYTKFHFAREERIMLRLQYAKYDEHKHAHGMLVEQLELAAKPIRESDPQAVVTTAGLPQETRDTLVILLRHWLLDHILKDDFKFKPLLAGYGRGFSAET